MFEFERFRKIGKLINDFILVELDKFIIAGGDTIVRVKLIVFSYKALKR